MPFKAWQRFVPNTKKTVQKGRHFDLGAANFKTLSTMTLTSKVYMY